MNQMDVNNMNTNDNINNINMKYSINKERNELINSIIKFYKENGNEYMNYQHPNQIRSLLEHLNKKYSYIYKDGNIQDPLPYIHENKKIIKFINPNIYIM